MQSFLELHAHTFYTNFSSTDNFGKWNYLNCVKNSFLIAIINFYSEMRKYEREGFLLPFFAATTIIFKTILFNNFVFHVLYFDFVVS